MTLLLNILNNTQILENITSLYPPSIQIDACHRSGVVLRNMGQIKRVKDGPVS